jgi:hypothetical protein
MRNEEFPPLTLEFRNSDFGFIPTHPRCDLRDKGAFNGGAWLPIRHLTH